MSKISKLEQVQHPPIDLPGDPPNPSGVNGVNGVKATLVFTVEHRTGALEETLKTVKALNISLTRLESRPSTIGNDRYDLFVDFMAEDEGMIKKIVDELRKSGTVLSVHATSNAVSDYDTPWFPRKKTDLDEFAEHCAQYGEELEADHPGFQDTEYRQRRAEITALARKHRSGMELPVIEYTEKEHATWRKVWTSMIPLWKKHACEAHSFAMPLLISNCGYSPDRIPQIRDASRFLKECTGFTLRPVMGLLSPRDFLNGLAFRVFHSTQYIRHASKPLYTPEPDICHELLGHVPLFADPGFADFSQEIGLASLGVSDESIKRLSTIYWFTAEYGLCKDKYGTTKASGAGLLGGPGDCEHAFSGKAEHLPFDPFVASTTEYPITDVQPRFFVAESFRDAQEKVKQFAQSLDRPFSVRYNAYTERIEIIDTKEKILRIAHGVQGEMHTLIDALERLTA